VTPAMSIRSQHPVAKRPPARLEEHTLPFWPDPTRGVPNVILRSALCAAIGKGGRTYLDQMPLASFKNFSVLYTGQQLDQGDLSVWLMVLNYARSQRAQMGQEFRFTAYGMLTGLRKTDTGGNRKVLHKRLLRLTANAVEIVHDHRTYVGSLIEDFKRDEGTGEYVMTLNSKLLPFFDPDQFTQVSWEVRLDLEGKPLAQWLHGFYESHAAPFELRIASLMRWSGSENTNLRSATQKLRKALSAVELACADHGRILRWTINKGCVRVRWEC